MKYQIYLNKQSSELINRMANNQQKKPATLIKELMERLTYQMIETYKESEKDFEKR